MAVTTATQVTPALAPEIKLKDKAMHARWDLGEFVREEGTPYAKTVQARAELHANHDTGRRCFYATLMVVDVEGGCISVRPGDSLLVTREPVGRFSAKRLEAFFADALATLRANASDPRVLAKFDGAHAMPNPRLLV